MADALSRDFTNIYAVKTTSTGDFTESSEVKEEREGIIRKVHEELGHAGQEATNIGVLRRKTRTNMFVDIKKIVDSCSTCNKFNDVNLNLQKFRLNSKDPFYSVSIDIIGPLPKSLSGKKVYNSSCRSH